MELTLIPYKYYDSNYLIFISYIKDTILTIDEIKIINNSTGYFLEKNDQLKDYEYQSKNYHSCEMMYSYSKNSGIISCFHITNVELNSLIVSSFTINPLKKISDLSNQRIENTGYTLVKSATNKNKTKSLICFANGITNCTIFDIDKNKFSNVIYVFNNCVLSFLSLLTKFNSDKNEFTVSYKTGNNIISILTLDENFNIISNNNNYTSCINFIL